MGIADRFPSFRGACWRRARPHALVLLLVATALAGCLAVQGAPGTVSRARERRLATPTLPDTPYPYASLAQAAAARLNGRGPTGAGVRVRGGPGRSLDNTPPSNPITDAGATLGRVLFYDTRLSANDRVACASCHIQAFGFADTARFSRGFQGGVTRRHSMALANAGFYQNGRFFWDERAATLEAQVLLPVQDSVEMGMTLPALEGKLAEAGFYGPLFEAAFGTPDITSDRIARSLAQFIRALVSANSRFDRSQESVSEMTPQERQGLRLFDNRAMCWACHLSNTFASAGARNTGLDAVSADSGAGRGRFKAPSLRNVAVRPPYMHDGRFATLEQVIEHYAQGVQLNPNLDSPLRMPGGGIRSLGLSAADKAALVAYLGTLTDSAFLADPRFANPFQPIRRR